MTTIELTGIVVGALVALVAVGYVLVARAINAPDKGRHASPRSDDRDDDLDGAPTVAWLRSLHGIPPLAAARVYVTALRAVLRQAAAPVPVQAGPARVRVAGPVPLPPGTVPPVDEADHLQPRWEDATGTFSVIAGVNR